MKYIIDAISSDTHRKYAVERMIFFEKIIFRMSSLLLVFSLIFWPVNLKASANTEKQNDQLIQKISNDFTKKFCNGIGFGLSKESAMNFANKENNLIFQNKKGVDLLNKELIATNIAVSVIDSCGYPLNLKGEEGVNEIENDYKLMNNILSK